MKTLELNLNAIKIPLETENHGKSKSNTQIIRKMNVMGKKLQRQIENKEKG